MIEDIKNPQTYGAYLTGQTLPEAEEQPIILLGTFDDPVHLTDAVGGLGAWELEFVQLGKGRFRGELQQIALPTVALGRLRLGRSMHQRGTAPRGFFTFGISASAFPKTFMGEKPTRSSILIFPREGEFDSVSDATFDAFPMSFNEEHLNRVCGRLGLPEIGVLCPPQSTVTVHPSAIASIRLHLLRVLREIRTPSQLASRGVCEAIEFELPQRLLTALASRGLTERPRVRMRDTAIRRALEFIRGEQGRPVTVRQLCREVRVSWRTLDYAFRERFGVTPQAYLKAVRLNGVRRDLRNSDSGVTQVAEVAGRWGFWHMGQMAADYRKMFGQLPSQTLRGSVTDREPSSPTRSAP